MVVEGLKLLERSPLALLEDPLVPEAVLGEVPQPVDGVKVGVLFRLGRRDLLFA